MKTVNKILNELLNKIGNAQEGLDCRNTLDSGKIQAYEKVEILIESYLTKKD